MSTVAYAGQLAAVSPEAPSAETALTPGDRLRHSLIGLAIGIALFALAALAGLLFTAALFNYSVGALI
jgi:hypothetical protein